MCAEDAELVRQWRDGSGRRVMTVNNTFLLAPWCDAIFATDKRWWDAFLSDARKTGAELWCQTPKLAKDIGINSTPWKTDSGNSGERALRLAAKHYRADRIILLGFDLTNRNGLHWHGAHPEGWPNPKGDNFRTWRGWIARLVKEFPGIDWINASRDTALDCMPRASLEDALC